MSRAHRGAIGFIAARAAAVAAVLALAGCATAEYYTQAIAGHLDVVRREQPIADLLADPATSQPLRAELERVLAMRDFASRELALPDNGSYRSYADLGRPYVLWNVFAAAEFSVDATRSCFPVAGCVSYRGYYARADAERYAKALAARGFDVYIGGVPAYSTLGWFDDPVLNTFVGYPEGEVARILFHELAHQVVYVKDDSVFNESFAVTVERTGVRRWFARGTPAADVRAYEALRERREAFVALVLRFRARLDALYHEPIAEAAKRADKARLLAEMEIAYGALKAQWGGYTGFDGFFAQKLGNAHFAAIAVYTERVPAFERLLAREGNDLPRFYAAVKRLARLPKAERDVALDALAR
ncbi:MAG: aminopeptidase [Burkholderiales bacterium]|nr:aminopeptidase [Burkholderiales bacterium]